MKLQITPGQVLADALIKSVKKKVTVKASELTKRRYCREKVVQCVFPVMSTISSQKEADIYHRLYKEALYEVLYYMGTDCQVDDDDLISRSEEMTEATAISLKEIVLGQSKYSKYLQVSEKPMTFSVDNLPDYHLQFCLEYKETDVSETDVVCSLVCQLAVMKKTPDGKGFEAVVVD